MDQAELQVRPSCSSFVTALAWIFIVLTGFATFIAILQNIMISFFFPMDQMREAIHAAKGSENIPALFQFMLSHIQLFFAAFLVLSVALFTVSIALLKRKNWARIAFVFFLAFGIAWNIGGIFLQGAFFSSMPALPPNAPAEFRAQFESMVTTMLVFSVVMAIGISLLFAWLIKRLVSVKIRAEFQRGGL